MAKKSGFWGILAVAVVFGMVLLSCPNDTTEEDTWSNVTSLNQMDGTWKGSYSQTMTIKEAMEQDEEEWSSAMEALFGDMKVITGIEMTITIDAGAKTQATDMKMTNTYSGGNIDDVWSMFSEASGEGVTVDDSKHSITYTISSPAEVMLDEDIADMLGSGLQVNQSGTKVKIPAGSMDSGLPEIILEKQ